VKRFGLRLMPELYAHLNPMPYQAAVQMEQDLAEDLRRAGYTVTGGHQSASGGGQRLRIFYEGESAGANRGWLQEESQSTSRYAPGGHAPNSQESVAHGYNNTATVAIRASVLVIISTHIHSN
jgi:hypothetical protein